MTIAYLFDLCITTSIKGSILIVLVLGIQKFFREDFTSKWMYTLWSLVLIRLVLPISPVTNTLSLYNLGLVKRLQFNIHDVLLGRSGSVSENFVVMGDPMPTRAFIENAFHFEK